MRNELFFYVVETTIRKKSVQMPKWQYFLLFVLFNDDGPRWLVLVVVVVWFRAMDDRLNNNKKKYLADDWLSREHKFTSECVCRNWMSLFSYCVCVCVLLAGRFAIGQ